MKITNDQNFLDDIETWNRLLLTLVNCWRKQAIDNTYDLFEKDEISLKEYLELIVDINQRRKRLLEDNSSSKMDVIAKVRQIEVYELVWASPKFNPTGLQVR